MPSASTTSAVASSTTTESSLLLRARPVSVAQWNSSVIIGTEGGRRSFNVDELCIGRIAASAARGALMQPLADGDHQDGAADAEDEHRRAAKVRLEPGGDRRVGDEHLAGEPAEQRGAERDDDREPLHHLDQQRAAEDDQRDD